MLWILERDFWPPEREAALLVACRRVAEARLVEIAPDGAILGRTPVADGPVVAYGSKDVFKAAARYGWRPGVWGGPDDPAFAVPAYAAGLGELYLNAAHRIMDLEAAARLPDERVFLRPLDDGKSFGGLTLSPAEIPAWIARQRAAGYLPDGPMPVAVSPVQTLEREWRVVLVAGRAVASGRYRPDIAPTAPSEARAVAEQAAARFAPAPVFVADIAETPSGLRVVEYNAFNSADLYACDPAAAVEAVSAWAAAQRRSVGRDGSDGST